MKTVLFVPGFMDYLDDVTSHDYRAVLQVIESKGYKTVFVPIQWKRTTIMDWVTELEKVYKDHKPEETILAGFSYGSMTALLAASKRVPAELWLFSLSPYFAEDLAGLKSVWLKQIGKKRITAFEMLRFNDICPRITCPVKLFAGEHESIQLLQRFHEARTKFANCQAITVSNTLHVIDAAEYVETIKQNV